VDYLRINFKAGNNGKFAIVKFGVGYDEGMFVEDKIAKKKYIKVDHSGAVFSAIPDPSHTVLHAHEKLKER
jgi:hypothetical protein